MIASVRVFAVVLATLAWAGGSRADIAGEPAAVHALTGVTIVTGPGARPVEGTIVIRDGLVESVGRGVEVPEDAVVHRREGRTVYAGFIEPYLRLAEGAVPADTALARAGTAHENRRVRADARAADLLPLPEDLLDEMRGAGYAVALVAPAGGVWRGTAAVVSLGDGRAADDVIAADFAQVAAFEHAQEDDPTYPNSLMGAIALARQTLLDAGWHRDGWKAWRENGETERPEENAALRALEPVLARAVPVIFESENLEMMPRALAVAGEFGVRPVIVSGGSDEYRAPARTREQLTEAGADLVIAVDFPRAPKWVGADEAVDVELDALVHWERAPTNPRELERAGVRFAVTTQGLAKRAYVLARLSAAVRLGLSADAALAALTTEPARVLGIEDRVGTIAPGKAADLVVTTGPLFDPATKLEEVWIDGVRHGEDPRQAQEADVKGKWDLSIGASGEERRWRIEIKRVQAGLEGAAVRPDSGRALAGLRLERGVLSFALDTLAVTLRLDGKMLAGAASSGGEEVPAFARKAPSDPSGPDDLWTVHSETVPAWPPRADAAQAPRAVLIRDATLWTCAPAGKLEQADLLVVDGRIAAVGRDLGAPRNALVVDAAGRHVTPGLIDCHSHSSIAGDVNECTNSCTAEVRIGDVIDPRSREMYRELAGGLTTANLLHGSCNCIGGQNAVIKLRWGDPAEALLFAEAPPGIKFALGENVKQSNWGGDYRTRYPQTRMGVEQFIRERFDAALAYRAEWERFRRGGRKGAPPRTDLALDALLEVLDGTRLVHSHSYRADEIIMLIRVAEDYGFRIGTFQHVLEGYKAANEIARHGAGASSFSDWWSFKYEVVEAIPYNGELMWKRGVNVSFNSDSPELSRRLNLEAAKAVKWGDVPEEEALCFVTRNPAVQLGVGELVGTLEVGKHADFVLWSDHPLSDFAVCDETWIDGVRRFSREEDALARAAAMELREKLLAKALDLDRRHELDTTVDDKGSWPGTTLGPLWGESTADHVLEMGECR
ncbi:MAG: amidohydrolase family protein [Candidatus Eiseniibacteriota bacterium]